MRLDSLQPGDRFLQPDLDIVGTVLKINLCRVYVHLEGPSKLVKFEGRSFVAKGGERTDWAPSVDVERYDG